MNVKNVFLQRKFEDEIYMYPSPGFKSLVKSENVLRLKKAIWTETI